MAGSSDTSSDSPKTPGPESGDPGFPEFGRRLLALFLYLLPAGWVTTVLMVVNIPR